jgi:hypothetical protein
LQRGRLEGAGLDDEVALLLEHAVHPIDGLFGVARRLDREHVTALVLEISRIAGRARVTPLAVGTVDC